MSAYVIWEARNLGMSKWHLARMGANTLVDTAIGAIPLVGDLFDFAFRSNTRNLRIVRRHLDRHHPSSAVIEGEITGRSEEHTSELPSLMRISYAVFSLKTKN